MGAAVVRAYGLEDQDGSPREARDRRAVPGEIVAHWRSAALFPMSTFFYAVAVRSWSRSARSTGRSGASRSARCRRSCSWPTCSCTSFTDLPEIYAETQTAIAGWRKILAVLDLPIEIVEPEPGRRAPAGAAAGPHDRGVDYAYRDGRPGAARHSVEVERRGARGDRRRDRRVGRPRSRSCSPGSPTRRRGTSRSAGVDLRDVSPTSRRSADPDGPAGRVPVRHDRPRERAVRQADGAATGTSRPRSRSWA